MNDITSKPEIAACLRLNKNEDRRLLAGHCWVFSNEIDNSFSRLKEVPAGAWVKIESARGKTLGYGYANPHPLIAVRLLSKTLMAPEILLAQRLQQALQLRERLYQQPYYRWVYGEGDFLPGLIIDRYDDTVVIQINTAGMEVLREPLLAAIRKCINPKYILLKNDSSMRELENLPVHVDWVDARGEENIIIIENGLRFQAPLLQGQKTGWFFDQRVNRQMLPDIYKNARVLDLYSYVGSWGVNAAAQGAKEVISVDSAAYAVDYIKNNASLNHYQHTITAIKADAEKLLQDFARDKNYFDVVVIDPPAFIKRKKDADKGEAAYQRINRLALSVLKGEGFLVSCSCSHHLPAERLQRIVSKAAAQENQDLQLLAWGQQSPDHPVHPAMPETAYLKVLFGRAIKQS